MSTRPGPFFAQLFLPGAILAVALMPHSALAGLGEPEASVTNDVQQLRGSIKSNERSNYRVHEIQLPSGTVLREFATPGGTVFAVAWSGPAIPNLRQALGRYFDVFATAAQAKRGGRHFLHIKENDFVMHSSGHMRAFSGQAYLPLSLPAGTSPDELR